MNTTSLPKQRRLFRVFRNAVARQGVLPALYKAARYPFLPLLRTRNTAEEQAFLEQIIGSPDIESRFTKIYSMNYWGNSESVSGAGSTLSCTKTLRERLPALFEQFAIRRVLDAPCGDFNWMRLVVQQCDIEYVGADVVRPLIDSNAARFAGSRVSFAHLDITKDELPQADLWICRDCLFHFSFEDTRRALRQFVASKIPYVLTTTFENK
jgi:hypothetical protein